MKYLINDTFLKVFETQVQHKSSPLSLSDRGHACLVALLEAENEILSKDDLMKTLWKDVVVSDDSLFKVIQEVRKALLDIGIAKDSLKNVYGKGYQLQKVKKINSNNSPKKKSLILALLILLGIITTLYFNYNPTKDAINDDDFKAKVEQIKSNHSSINLDQVAKSKVSTALDKLKLAYLQGLICYKSGQYEQSIKYLQNGVSEYNPKTPHFVLADSYLLLSRMFIYRNKPDSLASYLASAKKYYQALDDQKGMLSTAISEARFQQSLFEYEQSIDSLNAIMKQAEQLNDKFNLMRVFANLSYSYQQTSQIPKAISSLEKTLDIALDTGNGRYAALAYGELAKIYMQQGHSIKAMGSAQKALHYVLAQKDTNVFQQGFSAFYNLLNELGHVKMAEKQLKSAIAIQAYFNDQALLVEAETNLAKANINMQKYNHAKTVLIKLLNSKLSRAEILSTEALLALVSYHLKDNISAYTKAKLVYQDPSATNQVKFQAGIVMVLAGMELERIPEAKDIFQKLHLSAQPHWRFEYLQYLNLSKLYYSEVQIKPEQLRSVENQLLDFEQQSQTLKEATKTNPELLKQLDAYIKKILKKPLHDS